MDFDLRAVALRAMAAVMVRLLARQLRVPRAFDVQSGCRAAAVLLAITLAAAGAGAQQPPPLIFSRQLRDEAVRAIPLNEMSPPVRAKLLNVVSDPTIYRRLPAQTVACDSDLHVFLVRYPEVVVNIWQLMGVTKVKVQRTGPLTFDALDGAGTVSRAELVYGTPEVHVFYAEGSYDGPLLQKPVTGSCVLLLRSSYSHRDGRPSVCDTLDVFAKLDHLGAEIIVKTLYPAVSKAVDYNFTESVRFLGQVSQSAELNGPGMQRLASHLRSVEPDVRESFARHVELAYQRAVLRRDDPSVPLASSATERTVEPAAGAAEEVETPLEEPRYESNEPATVRSGHLEEIGPQIKPMFRR